MLSKSGEQIIFINHLADACKSLRKNVLTFVQRCFCVFPINAWNERAHHEKRYVLTWETADLSDWWILNILHQISRRKT